MFRALALSLIAGAALMGAVDYSYAGGAFVHEVKKCECGGTGRGAFARTDVREVIRKVEKRMPHKVGTAQMREARRIVPSDNQNAVRTNVGRSIIVIGQ